MVELPAGSTPPDWCGLCSRSVADGGISHQFRDSSYLHASDPSQDGLRTVIACSQEHFELMAVQYRDRLFSEDELWASKVTRATHEAMPGGVWGEELERVTGLTHEQVLRAAEWNRARTWNLSL